MTARRATTAKARQSAAAAAVGLALWATSAHAADQDAQLWWQGNVTVPVNDDVRVTLEQIARFSDEQGGLYTTEFGGLASYRVAPGIDLGLGYRYVSYYNRNTAKDENRLRQQIVVTRGPLLVRFRVDERFHPDGKEIGFRLRPLIRYNQPLGRHGLMAFASHESFILPNSTRWGQRSGYERMRNIVGVTVPLNRLISADIGYLNQYYFARNGARAEMDHALTIQLSVDLAKVIHPKADD